MTINRRGSKYIDFYITDRELLFKIRKILGSNHRISVRERNSQKWKFGYRLQIGSKELYNDLLRLGLFPNKAKRLNLPTIPKKYFPDFIRGYFDGDGCVSFGFYSRRHRKNKVHILTTRFTSGNKKFLENLLMALKINLHLKGGFITAKKNAFDLVFSVRDSFRICQYMYENVKDKLFLKRKFNIFQRALNYWRY